MIDYYLARIDALEKKVQEQKNYIEFIEAQYEVLDEQGKLFI
jgi:hypothetical protein